MLRLVQILQQLFQLEGEAFVEELYRQILGREAEATIKAYHAPSMRAHSPKMNLMLNLLRSREARLLYMRPSMGAMLNGSTIQHLILGTLNSNTDDAFVASLYQQLLSRDPEPDAVQHYAIMLQGGQHRYAIVVGMLSAEECTGLIASGARHIPPGVSFGQYALNLNKSSFTLHTPAPKLTRKLSIVILTWNGLDYTKRCLQSLSYLAGNPLVDIMVFDNGSRDGTVSYLKSLPWIKHHAHPDNIGFPAGNNAAIALCDPESDIVLLNNDIVVTDHNWLEKLQQTAYSDTRVGVVGCRLVGEDGRLQHAGTFIFSETCWGQQIGGQEVDIQQHERVQDVQGVVFACTYLKRSMMNHIGLLDTEYFAYFEDTEYCLRALAHHYRVICDGRVTLIHTQNTTTKVNKVNFNKLFETSRDKFRRKWGSYLDQSYELPVNWHSIANVSSGYANSSRKLMVALDEQHVKVHYRYVYGPGTPNPAMEPQSSNDYRVNLFNSRHKHPHATEVVYGQGDVFFKNNGRYKIGYSMLEVDGLPRDWVHQCNQMNEVWVPSHFNVSTFRDSGVRVPMYVMPLGVDPNYFNPNIRATRFSDRFTFLTVFEWGERKAPLEMLQTFINEFRHDEVLLVCKVTNQDPHVHVHEELRKLDLQGARCSIHLLYNQNLEDYLLGSLYRAADCFVLPTRGEGWGMPILEAMACGLPTIATNWSAQTDFLNDTTGFPIRVKGLVPAVAKCPYYHGFRWAEPDLEHMASLMRFVYTHHEQVKKRSELTAHYILNNWSWAHAAQKIKNRLKQIM